MKSKNLLMAVLVTLFFAFILLPAFGAEGFLGVAAAWATIISAVIGIIGTMIVCFKSGLIGWIVKKYQRLTPFLNSEIEPFHDDENFTSLGPWKGRKTLCRYIKEKLTKKE